MPEIPSGDLLELALGVKRFLGPGTPQTFTWWACDQTRCLQTHSSVALFCSRTAPAGILLAVHDLAQAWRQEARPIIGGFHSPVEQEALTILLRPPGRVILCPARGIEKMRLKREWREPLSEGRLALLSPFPGSLRRPTRETAYQRNRLVAALAETVLIAHARPGSSTWSLVEEVLAWDKPIYTLEHSANEALLELGVRVWHDP